MRLLFPVTLAAHLRLMTLKKLTGFNYRILVVDDEPNILKVSALVLGAGGYDVRTASDGFAALVELRSLPDILISDLSMPYACLIT
jgi:two-component system OmpR family response regulator